MRLSKLILEQQESILQDFEEFARAYSSHGQFMSAEALRDHAAEMLAAIADDLEHPQTPNEQERKAKGEGTGRREIVSAAEKHGLGRAESGFSLQEAFGECRALRASVMRHWTAAVGTGWSWSEIEDVIRFNEAIDQAIAESTREYSKAVTGYRDMFLAVLGHDLRSPLSAMMGASELLAREEDRPEREQRAVRLIRDSGERMSALIEDLMDYARIQLGEDVNLRPVAGDLGEIVQDLVRAAQSAHPAWEFRTTLDGDLTGEWDVRRLRQALSNLLDNAVQHGDAAFPVSISASEAAGDDVVVVTVQNAGDPISPEARGQIFEPFNRGADGGSGGGSGLGLYIIWRVADAHGGSVDVESSNEKGTIFTLRLPRRPPGQTVR